VSKKHPNFYTAEEAEEVIHLAASDLKKFAERSGIITIQVDGDTLYSKRQIISAARSIRFDMHDELMDNHIKDEETIKKLTKELEQQIALFAQTQKIVAAFADQDTRINAFEERYCPYCTGHYDEEDKANDFWIHDPECLIIQARELMKKLVEISNQTERKYS
jgi:hypothetical protein